MLPPSPSDFYAYVNGYNRTAQRCVLLIGDLARAIGEMLVDAVPTQNSESQEILEFFLHSEF